MVSLYARILHCLLRVSGKATLQEYTSLISSFPILKSHTQMIYDQYANPDIVQELRKH